MLRTVVLEKTLESPLDSKEVKPVNPKGNQSWILNRRTDAEAETPVIYHLMWTVDSLEKFLMLGKIEGRRRGPQRMRWLDGIPDSIDMLNSRRWWRTGKSGMLHKFMGLQRVGHDWWTDWPATLLTTTEDIKVKNYTFQPTKDFLCSPLLMHFGPSF